MTLLDLIAALRLRLDDQGGATGTIPTGYSYYWEADDAGCLWKNAELTDAINQAQVDFCQRNPIMDPTPTITLVVNHPRATSMGYFASAGYNPVLEGDDDGSVALASAVLPEAKDVAQVFAEHTLLLASPAVGRYTAAFLKTGKFPADARRPRPIPSIVTGGSK
jgi:hypothetical protein